MQQPRVTLARLQLEEEVQPSIDKETEASTSPGNSLDSWINAFCRYLCFLTSFSLAYLQVLATLLIFKHEALGIKWWFMFSPCCASYIY